MFCGFELLVELDQSVPHPTHFLKEFFKQFNVFLCVHGLSFQIGKCEFISPSRRRFARYASTKASRRCFAWARHTPQS